MKILIKITTVIAILLEGFQGVVMVFLDLLEEEEEIECLINPLPL
jgi:hypothetical protein